MKTIILLSLVCIINAIDIFTDDPPSCERSESRRFMKDIPLVVKTGGKDITLVVKTGGPFIVNKRTAVRADEVDHTPTLSLTGGVEVAKSFDDLFKEIAKMKGIQKLKEDAQELFDEFTEDHFFSLVFGNREYVQYLQMLKDILRDVEELSKKLVSLTHKTYINCWNVGRNIEEIGYDLRVQTEFGRFLEQGYELAKELLKELKTFKDDLKALRIEIFGHKIRAEEFAKQQEKELKRERKNQNWHYFWCLTGIGCPIAAGIIEGVTKAEIDERMEKVRDQQRKIDDNIMSSAEISYDLLDQICIWEPQVETLRDSLKFTGDQNKNEVLVALQEDFYAQNPNHAGLINGYTVELFTRLDLLQQSCEDIDGFSQSYVENFGARRVTIPEKILGTKEEYICDCVELGVDNPWRSGKLIPDSKCQIAADEIKRLPAIMCRYYCDICEDNMEDTEPHKQCKEKIINWAIANVGCTNKGQNVPDGVKFCNWECYLERYGDLRDAFGNDLDQARNHYETHRHENRDCTCNGLRAPKNVKSCKGDWSNWSACSKDCKGGLRSRSFTITQAAENNGYVCPESPAFTSCNRDIPCPCEESLASLEGAVVKNPEDGKVYYIAAEERYLVPEEMCASHFNETGPGEVDRARNLCQEMRLEDSCVEHQSWPFGGNYTPRLLLKPREFCKGRQNEINMGVEAAYAMQLSYEVEKGMPMKKGDVLDFGWKVLENHSGNEQGGWRALVWVQPGTCMVAFKGTTSGGNWAQANLLAEPFRIGNVNVHLGFYTMAKVASGKLKKQFGNGKHCSGKKVVITGHSLGGAVADVFSWALLSGRFGLKKRRKADVTTITFAQPQTFLKTTRSIFWIGDRTERDCPKEIYNNARSYRYVLTSYQRGKTVFDPLPRIQLPTLDQFATGVFILPPNPFYNYSFKHCNRGIQIQIDAKEENGLKIYKVHKEANWPTGKGNFKFLFTDTNAAALLKKTGNGDQFASLHRPYRYKRAMDANVYDGTCKTDYN